MTHLDRITFDPNLMGGRASIRGMRITVSLVRNLVSDGMTTEEIMRAYPYLEAEDIRHALRYAAWLLECAYYQSAIDETNHSIYALSHTR